MCVLLSVGKGKGEGPPGEGLKAMLFCFLTLHSNTVWLSTGLEGDLRQFRRFSVSGGRAKERGAEGVTNGFTVTLVA